MKKNVLTLNDNYEKWMKSQVIQMSLWWAAAGLFPLFRSVLHISRWSEHYFHKAKWKSRSMTWKIIPKTNSPVDYSFTISKLWWKMMMLFLFNVCIWVTEMMFSGGLSCLFVLIFRSFHYFSSVTKHHFFTSFAWTRWQRLLCEMYTQFQTMKIG